VRRQTRGLTLLDARAPLVEPLLALHGRQRRPPLRCSLKNRISARLSGHGHDSVLVHPGLDSIAHRLLLVRVEIVVPVLQGFFDVVFVIAAVRMVVDPDPEIVVIPVVMLIEPVIVDVRDRAAVGRALARVATKAGPPRREWSLSGASDHLYPLSCRTAMRRRPRASRFRRATRPWRPDSHAPNPGIPEPTLLASLHAAGKPRV
jgi:hypothetical protein